MRRRRRPRAKRPRLSVLAAGSAIGKRLRRLEEQVSPTRGLRGVILIGQHQAGRSFEHSITPYAHSITPYASCAFIGLHWTAKERKRELARLRKVPEYQQPPAVLSMVSLMREAGLVREADLIDAQRLQAMQPPTITSQN
jgi:hypothetical protein